MSHSGMFWWFGEDFSGSSSSKFTETSRESRKFKADNIAGSLRRQLNFDLAGISFHS
jgi:hypothetical protein